MPTAQIAQKASTTSQRPISKLSSYASDPNNIIDKYLSPRGGGVASLADTTTKLYRSGPDRPDYLKQNDALVNQTKPNAGVPQLAPEQPQTPRYQGYSQETPAADDITQYARPIQQNFTGNEIYDQKKQLSQNIALNGDSSIGGHPAESYAGGQEQQSNLNDILKSGLVNSQDSAMFDSATGKVFYQGKPVDRYDPNTGKAYVGDRELSVQAYNKSHTPADMNAGPVGQIGNGLETYYEAYLNSEDYGAINEDPTTGKIVVDEVGGLTPEEMNVVIRKAQAISAITGKEIIYNKAKNPTAQFYETVTNDDGTSSYVLAPDMKDLYDKYMFFNDEKKATDPNYIINEAMANILGGNVEQKDAGKTEPGMLDEDAIGDNVVNTMQDISTYGFPTAIYLASLGSAATGAAGFGAMAPALAGSASTGPGALPISAILLAAFAGNKLFGGDDDINYTQNISARTKENIMPMLQSASYNIALKEAKEKGLNFQQFSQLKEYYNTSLMNQFSSAILNNIPKWGEKEWESDRQQIESDITSKMTSSQREDWDSMPREYKSKYIDDLRSSAINAREMAKKLAERYTDSSVKTATDLFKSGTPIKNINFVDSDTMGKTAKFSDVYNMSPSLNEDGFDFMPKMKYDEASNKLVAASKTGRKFGIDKSKKTYKVYKDTKK